MIEQYGLHLMLAGFALMAIAVLWIVARAIGRRFGSRRASAHSPLLESGAEPRGAGLSWAPPAVLALGLALTAFPPLYTRLTPVDLGPHERIVDGERHLTLTGWDRKDYGVLGSKSDTVVLQMANADVDDETLRRIKGFARLRELDLNDTKVTDEGLKVLKDLPALTTLSLANTKVTDAGFRASLAPKESLRNVDLTGTAVSPETVEAWRSAAPGRQAMQ